MRAHCLEVGHCYAWTVLLRLLFSEGIETGRAGAKTIFLGDGSYENFLR